MGPFSIAMHITRGYALLILSYLNLFLAVRQSWRVVTDVLFASGRRPAPDWWKTSHMCRLTLVDSAMSNLMGVLVADNAAMVNLTCAELLLKMAQDLMETQTFQEILCRWFTVTRCFLPISGQKKDTSTTLWIPEIWSGQAVPAAS